ncbi:MAG: LemA family protein [Actinomycetales bacterium]
MNLEVAMAWLLIILIALAVIILITVVVQFNKLRRLDQLCIGSFADIDTLLTKRADLIPNLDETVKGARDFESSTLESGTAARTASMQASTVEAKAEADGGLSAALGRLFSVAEAYPQLTATENFRDLQGQLAEVESQLQFSRQFYNDTVVTLNTALRTIPSMWFAGIAGVSVRPVYAETDTERRAAPRVDFNGNS